MAAISVVIITRNEEHNISECIQSAQLLSDDILVVDAASSDRTTAIAAALGARIVMQPWQGYGHARNIGARKAQHNWIFALDADERITPQLAASIKNQQLDQHFLYQFKRDNYIGQRRIRFGTAGFDKVIRLYNRKMASWDLTVVHERLTGECRIKKIPGSISHFSIRDIADYHQKSMIYAKLSADKYLQQGKKAGLVKRFISPMFNSVKSYIFQFGFLDGKTGLQLARVIAQYTWLKYYYLHKMQNREIISAPFTITHKEPAQAEIISMKPLARQALRQ